MLEIPADFEEKYKDSILKFLCERQNQKIKSNSKDTAFEIGNGGLESLLKEINEGPCKESPITKEVLSAIFESFFKNSFIKIYKGKPGKYVVSEKAYGAVKIDILKPPRLQRKKTMEIHENIQCRNCLIVNGYTPKQTKCRYCGTPLFPP